MTEDELTALAESWIAFTLAPKDSPEYENLFWVFDREWELINQQPEIGWRLILKILSVNHSNTIQGNLAAGPLEDLLSKHSNNFIERVELEAKSNPTFAQLLGGVWQFTMSDDIWERVQAVWNRSGWDGIP